MKKYDKKKPLIAIHLPKAGGTSFGKILRQWYGSKFYTHYRDTMPKKIKLRRLFSNQFREGICIYGHFNKNRGFGIKSYYPEVDQFITIIRDPFEMAVSEYFFLKKVGNHLKNKSRIPDDDVDIETYLTRITPNMLNHFPFDLNMDNYKDLLEENFIHIGITEDMDTSTRIIGEKLGFTIFPNVETLNKTERIQRVPYESKKAFIEKHPVEYAVYEFARSNYNK